MIHPLFMVSLEFRMKVYIVVLGIVLISGIAGFMALEGLSFIDAFYFCVVTIATVGYGDIHPVTGAGKILAIVMIVAGVGTFVAVVANGLEMYLNSREKTVRMRKINMIVGVFFSEIGTPCLNQWSQRDPGLAGIRDSLIVRGDWTTKEFSRSALKLGTYDSGPAVDAEFLAGVKECLAADRDLMLRLLENPVIFEHEAFTDALRALFHLSEELGHRQGFDTLPSADIAHLAGDIKRAYLLLIRQWLGYMQHLKGTYPYLFSLAARTNPFDPGAMAVLE